MCSKNTLKRIIVEFSKAYMSISKLIKYTNRQIEIHVIQYEI